MTEMTIKVSVPVDVSRNALATWVSAMLNVPFPPVLRDWMPQVAPEELDLLDEMDGDVDVTWGAEDAAS